MRIGSRNERDAATEQAVQQAAQDHRVADVADKEFVEAQYTRFPGDIRGNLVERILRVAEQIQTLVNFSHDPVKVDPLLVFDIQRFEKNVHQERFAASNAAPDIETFHRGIFCRRAPLKQPRKAAFGPA